MRQIRQSNKKHRATAYSMPLEFGHLFGTRGYLVPQYLMIGMLTLSAIIACQRDEVPSCDGDPADITRPSFWTPETHCKGVVPNYDKVFDDKVVHRFDITVTPEDYQAMEDNLNYLAWESILPPDLDDLESPIWVPADIKYNGNKWTKVGMRWKGHSSLIGAWKTPIKKLSFMLDFDFFEEANPDLDDQRFYGFKKIIFANGYTDQSFIREKVAAEIFRRADIPVPRNAFAEVWADFGEGSVYLGLYTFMEDPSDKMLENQFGYYNDSVGNMYKPHGDAARWRDPDEAVDGGDADWWQNDIEIHFEKCTNDDALDWTDIMKVIEKLHKDRNEPDEWRADLETVFDVQSFIKTLAVGRTIMNWDSYGCMHHNYYVYANPFDYGRFVWLPWDFGETMSNRQDGTCPDLDGVMLDEIVYPDETSSIDTYWPLIQFILGDAVYREDFKKELRNVLDGPFATSAMFAIMDKYHNLIAPHIVGPKAVEVWPYTTCDPHDCSAFTTSLTEGDAALKPHVEARRAAVEQALGM